MYVDDYALADARRHLVARDAVVDSHLISFDLGQVKLFADPLGDFVHCDRTVKEKDYAFYFVEITRRSELQVSAWKMTISYITHRRA